MLIFKNPKNRSKRGPPVPSAQFWRLGCVEARALLGWGHLCSKFLSAQILIKNSNFVFRILIQFVESKLSFSTDISPFYVMVYNSKTCIGVLNIDLDSKLKLKC